MPKLCQSELRWKRKTKLESNHWKALNWNLIGIKLEWNIYWSVVSSSSLPMKLLLILETWLRWKLSYTSHQKQQQNHFNSFHPIFHRLYSTSYVSKVSLWMFFNYFLYSFVFEKYFFNIMRIDVILSNDVAWENSMKNSLFCFHFTSGLSERMWGWRS